MDKEQLQSLEEIVRLFNQGGLSKMKVSLDGMSVELEKAGAAPLPEIETPAKEEKEETGALITVTAPLVGVFYASPSPDDAPYVAIGDRVSENSTLCLIESMKVFTEIPAGVSGVVEEILVHSGDYVEYDQPLFKIRTLK
ncbi:biotin/lipoyl-containing protein [Dialister sp.]|jgi:acetyl-CoA carboxylase biotin carboxyl carrier protein|uniref:acetyl-CoA carboxylase biotin carboxyl carrier protein n=1 Tax=Dialister sp. TaxID=1955814 RepID=UPI0025FCB2EC|nr:biotin/lipoyl-containing protein [Dialister sp.]MEE0292087.1 biotin/lipoyl-containing protein [Dialister sp.]